MTMVGVQESLKKQTDKKGDINRIPLAKHVRAAMDIYFQDLDGQIPSDLYRMVLNEVEKPLLEAVMHQARGNQSRAAEILGLNRTTLRKKLQQHNL
jgi:Fis family transcriptional regulator